MGASPPLYVFEIILVVLFCSVKLRGFSKRFPQIHFHSLATASKLLKKSGDLRYGWTKFITAGAAVDGAA
jgi:hypothetical protein